MKAYKFVDIQWNFYQIYNDEENILIFMAADCSTCYFLLSAIFGIRLLRFLFHGKTDMLLIPALKRELFWMFEGLEIFEPRFRSGEHIPERASSVERGDR